MEKEGVGDRCLLELGRDDEFFQESISAGFTTDNLRRPEFNAANIESPSFSSVNCGADAAKHPRTLAQRYS